MIRVDDDVTKSRTLKCFRKNVINEIKKLKFVYNWQQNKSKFTIINYIHMFILLILSFFISYFT